MSAAAVIQHLRSGPDLCSWLGLVKEDHPCASPCMGAKAHLAAEVAEVCVEALMWPHQASLRTYKPLLSRQNCSEITFSLYCSNGGVSTACSIATLRL